MDPNLPFILSPAPLHLYTPLIQPYQIIFLGFVSTAKWHHLTSHHSKNFSHPKFLLFHPYPISYQFLLAVHH